MLRAAFLIACCTLVAACVAPSAKGPATPGAPPFTSQFVTGGWVLDGDSCDSDAGVIYRKDGRWLAQGVAGTWQVRKGRLIETILEQEGASGDMHALVTPIHYKDEVRVTGPDAFVLSRGDGTVRHLRRCSGAAER